MLFLKKSAIGSHCKGRMLPLPLLLFFVLILICSVGWFIVRNNAVKSVDAWIVSEQQQGRDWLCENRQVTGFPFRIEISCEKIGFKSAPFNVQAGHLVAVAQVYNPFHVIFEITGPLVFEKENVKGEASWQVLQSSFRFLPDQGFVGEGSLVVQSPALRFLNISEAARVLTSDHLELHIRPNPKHPAQDHAYDVAVTSRALVFPELDILTGNNEAASFATQLTIAQAPLLVNGLQQFDDWRLKNGRIDIEQFSFNKGVLRIDTKGQLQLDEEHRPKGSLSISAAGYEDLLKTLSRGRLSGLSFGLPSTSSGLSSFPPLHLNNGRILVGPLTIPGLRLNPVY